MMPQSQRNLSLDEYFGYLYDHHDGFLRCMAADEASFYPWRGQFRAMLQHGMGGFPTERA